MIERGRSPIIEARMNEMVAEANRARQLHATTDARTAVLESDVSFVCVGTPSLRNGKLDLSHIEKAVIRATDLSAGPANHLHRIDGRGARYQDGPFQARLQLSDGPDTAMIKATDCGPVHRPRRA